MRALGAAPRLLAVAIARARVKLLRENNVLPSNASPAWSLPPGPDGVATQSQPWSILGVPMPTR